MTNTLAVDEAANADWLKVLSWDLPKTKDAFLAAIGGEDKLVRFMQRPAAKAMPDSLRKELGAVAKLATITVERPVSGYPRVVDGEVQRVRPHMRKMRVNIGDDFVPPSPQPEVIDHTPDTETVEWEETIEEIREQGIGNCYEASMTILMRERTLGLKNPVIVQGSFMGNGGPALGSRFWHSWVEADGPQMKVNGEWMPPFRIAIDYSSGKSTVMDAALFRHIAQAEDLMEYTVEEAIEASIHYQFYGLWREDRKGYP